jgi:hypothetical protein
MEDHAPTYESEPRRSMMQLFESQPLYDRFVAAYQNTSHCYGWNVMLEQSQPAMSGPASLRVA